MIRIWLTLAALIVIMGSSATAVALKTERGRASVIRVQNNSATMSEHKDYFITCTSQQVGKGGIPQIIRLGDTIRVQDKEITVNYIFWTKFLERSKEPNGTIVEAGVIRCVAVESLDDQPSAICRDRLWIYVRDCALLRR